MNEQEQSFWWGLLRIALVVPVLALCGLLFVLAPLTAFLSLRWARRLAHVHWHGWARWERWMNLVVLVGFATALWVGMWWLLLHPFAHILLDWSRSSLLPMPVLACLTLLLFWGLNVCWMPAETLLLLLFWPLLCRLNLVSGASAASPLTLVTPESLDGNIVMGRALQGDLWPWVRGIWLTYPLAALSIHAAVVGRSGAGKSETLLRIAYLAAKIYRMKVIFLDAKGDWETAARFRLHMREAGIARLGIFPTGRHNGWLGDPHDLLNKLLASQRFSEEYYLGVATNMLTLAIQAPGGPPTDSATLLYRLNPQNLKRIYKGKPEFQEIQALRPDVSWGVYHRYASFFRAVRGKLDGEYGYGEWDAAYFLLDGVRLQDESAHLGRFLITDFEQYLAIRKHGAPKRRVLIIIDEFSAISGKADAVGLFERIRSLGGSVMVSSQSYAGLGEYANRLLATAATVIVHACVLPQVFSVIAGMRPRPDLTYQVSLGTDEDPGDTQMNPGQEPTDRIAVHQRQDYRVKASDIQQLAVGRAFFVHGGTAQCVDVTMLTHNVEEVRLIEAQLYEEYLASQQQQSNWQKSGDRPTQDEPEPSPPPEVYTLDQIPSEQTEEEGRELQEHEEDIDEAFS